MRPPSGLKVGGGGWLGGVVVAHKILMSAPVLGTNWDLGLTGLGLGLWDLGLGTGLTIREGQGTFMRTFRENSIQGKIPAGQ